MNEKYLNRIHKMIEWRVNTPNPTPYQDAEADALVWALEAVNTYYGCDCDDRI